MPAHPLDRPADCPAPGPTPGPVRALLIFCGSRPGVDPRHAALARAVGGLCAAQGITLVYGGGALGLMGEAGRACLDAGGRVKGIIPQFLQEWEVAEPRCSDLLVVDSLHARKTAMFETSDAVLALPGGIGTLDELVEILSWRNLRLHAKPVWLMGDGDYWRPFRMLLHHLVREGFAGPEVTAAIEELPDAAALAARLGAP